MEVTWQTRGNRGIWECVAGDGRVLGGCHELRRNQWSGWTSNGVKTGEFRLRLEVQRAVEVLIEVGAYPTPKPTPALVKKVWKRVPNSPD